MSRPGYRLPREYVLLRLSRLSGGWTRWKKLLLILNTYLGCYFAQSRTVGNGDLEWKSSQQANFRYLYKGRERPNMRKSRSWWNGTMIFSRIWVSRPIVSFLRNYMDGCQLILRMKLVHLLVLLKLWSLRVKYYCSCTVKGIYFNKS